MSRRCALFLALPLVASVAVGTVLGQPPVVQAKDKKPAVLDDKEILRLILGPLPVFLEPQRAIDVVAVSGGGKTVTTVSNLAAEVLLWDARTGTLRRRVRLPIGSVTASAISADGSRLAVVDFATKVSVWDAVTGWKLHKMNGASGLCMTFSDDGKTVVASTALGRLGVWDAGTGKQRCTLPGSAGTRGTVIALSPDGKVVAATQPDGSVGLWDATTGKALRSIAAGMQRCRLLAFTPDSGGLAACDGTGRVRFWDVASAQERLRFLLPADHVITAGRFSADGRTLLTAGKDGTVRMWELATGAERRRFPSNEVGVRALALSADGKALVSAGNDDVAVVREVGPWAMGLSPPPATTRLGALWDDLADPHGGIAYQAIAALAARPAEAASFLKGQLHPAVSPDPKTIARLLKELDSSSFARREKAMHALQQFGRAVEPDLQAALKDKPTLEMRKRIESLLDKLTQPNQDRERRRTLRAIEVLELAGTRSARQVLRYLAGGVPGHENTRQAQAALRRLEHRPVSGP